MKSKVAVVLFILFLASAFSVAAGEKTSTPAPGVKPRLVIASLEHSFGEVKPGTPLSYSFTMKNQGNADLEIRSVSPACGCTTSQFDKVIPPGKEGRVTLEIKDTQKYRGEVVKNATVTTNDPDRQTLTLVLRATFKAE